MMETKYICHVWAELEVLVNKLQLTLVHTSLVILVKKMQYAMKTNQAMANQL